MMLNVYTSMMLASRPILKSVLNRRLRSGKENPERIEERMGKPSIQRPSGTLYWFHGASIGESQSCLILIDRILKEESDAHILLTTGTLTSAKLVEKQSNKRIIHQFYPLDHPKWCSRFLDHWKPDAAFWMESELWPVMLRQIKERDIPGCID